MKKISFSNFPYFPYNSSSVSRFKKAFLVCLALTLCTMIMLTPALALSSDNETLPAESIISEQGNVSEYNHLIEVSLLNTGYVVVSESMVYLIESSGNLDSKQTEIKLWIPENAEIMQFQTTDMAGSNSVMPVNFTRDGNYLYFYSEKNESSSAMPLLYGIRYVLPDTGDQVLRKVIYKNGELEQPISRLILTVYHDDNTGISLSSENGALLTADDTLMEANYSSYVWNTPEFNEFTITREEKDLVQDTATSGNNLVIPVLIVILIVVAAGYYYMRKNSPANSKDINELEDLYEAEMAVLDRIKKDRKNNKLSQEEFDKLEKKHSESASKIKKEMEKLKKT
ncbi:hypothetical protein RE474_12130 [Methanolobus sediminis]|uniref:Uncharacterized protein n=1 Tax=Methanolobus sediminis TaxID=3072978 RepID=A0AA51UK15_9EURY|nr:hypothetical protein [Methanolobus sediminis]WMW24814.1 hypothetical protein RE474_12130 [Methanolobus sediminis]